MQIEIKGEIKSELINQIMAEKQVKLLLDKKVDDKINGIVNKYFDNEHVDQTVKTLMNNAARRIASTEGFKESVIEMVAIKVSEIMGQKDLTKMIDDSCKKYIDSVINKIKSI